MPKLIVYVPFPRAAVQQGQSDLRDNANDLAADASVPCIINGVQIDEIVVVFAGEEANNPLAPGDLLVVHAHGGANGTVLSDNLGSNITQANLMQNLATLQADNAAMAFFIACYSSVARHSAPTWRAAHQQMPTFGAPGQVQGAIAQVTRQGTIRNAMFFTGDPRMTQMP